MNEKQIKLPKKDIESLFKFLEDNQIDEYAHNIKRVIDKSMSKGLYDYSLKIKKDRWKGWWIGTFSVGAYLVIKIIDKWETLLQIDNINGWIGFFLFFGLIGILICSHFLFKIIIEVFIYKNKFVRLQEDKVNRKPLYFKSWDWKNERE